MDIQFFLAIILFVVPVGGLLVTGGTRRLQARTPTRLDGIFLIVVGIAAGILGFWTLGKSTLGTLVFYGCGALMVIYGIMVLAKSHQ